MMFIVERCERADKGISPGLWSVARVDNGIAMRIDLHLFEDDEARADRNSVLTVLRIHRGDSAHVCSECETRATSGDHFESILS